MDVRQKRIEIFQDTMEWIKSDVVLTRAVELSQKGTKLYQAGEEIPIADRKADRQGKIEVSKRRTFEAAQRYAKDRKGKKIAVLNFASATNPGGGVERGSSAQEESLCRCSTLYPCLATDYLKSNFYRPHRDMQDVRYTNTCIYTPGVVVIKSDTASPNRLSEKDWYSVDVISCAAPNLREKPYNQMNPGHGKPVRMTAKELFALHLERAKHIIKVAIENSADVLILGAFGCGAFENDPNVVARAYYEVLKEYRGYFDCIEFAVYCGPNDTANYDVFSRWLGRK